LKLIFALTAGRTGSAYLAELLRQNVSDAEVHHERLGYTSFGIDTPDISHFHAYNTFGVTSYVNAFWQRKINTILSCGKPCYAETSHVLMKAGLVENAVAMAGGHDIHFILLKRNVLDTIVSYHQRCDFLNYSNMWMRFLDPNYAMNMIRSAPFIQYGLQGVRLWYLNEIAVRSEVFRLLYSHYPNVHFHTVDIADLNDKKNVAALLKQLGLPSSSIVLPPKQNVTTEGLPMSDEEREALKRFLDTTALDPVAFARELVQTQREQIQKQNEQQGVGNSNTNDMKSTSPLKREEDALVSSDNAIAHKPSYAADNTTTRDEARILYETCPLCGEAQISPLLTADCSKHPLYHPAISTAMTWCRCAVCGHVFTDGYFTKEAAALVFSKTHENQKVGYDLENQRAVSAAIIDKVVPFVQAGCWLDVGFGNASLLFTAQEYGFVPVGIDLRKDSVAALADAGVEAHCVDIVTLDQPGRFNVISLADVIEHMPFPKQGLAAAYSLLMKGGVVIVSMPNSESALWRGLTAHNINPYWGELEHYHNFGRTSLYRLLKETGFTPLRYGISQRYRACMEVIAQKTEVPVVA
jgi:SAM-dependent methyltransferase